MESAVDPVLGMADGIITLSLMLEGETSRRRLQIRKMRGQRSLHDLQPIRISDHGVQVFPRTSTVVSSPQRPSGMTERLSVGVSGLDEMLGGGIPYGDVVLVSGASGTGKSVLATHFLVEGSHQDEPGVAALFDEGPHTFVTRARELGTTVDRLFHAGQVRPLDLRSLDLSVEEILLEIRQAVAQTGARRVVIDSLAGLRMVTRASSRAPFEELVHRLVSPLTAAGLTVLMTTPDQSLADLVSFLADDLIQLEQVHVQHHLQRTVGITKMRASGHSSELSEYDIGGAGMRLPHDALIFARPISS
jgi:circadian clock protein KaiC